MSDIEWNAAVYDVISDPMFAWGMALLASVPLKGDERVLDAGCGSGRLTEELVRRLPAGRVVALDHSSQMLEQARRKLGDRVDYVQASLENFELAAPVDGIFSNAVLHWVPDHAAMFRALHRALRQGGWLVAQFGGIGNLSRTYRQMEQAASEERFRGYLARFEAGPHFEDVESTRARMLAAGFKISEAKLHQEAPRFDNRNRFRSFIETVILRQPLARLPEELRGEYLEAVLQRTFDAEGGYALDYVRLTVRATA
jgi:trans-aconitate 2-methyltransferase